MNPIQGIVRGEAVIDGDASGGIDLVLYAVTPGWSTLSGVSITTTFGDPVRILATSSHPFVGTMVGKTISFVKNGSREIVEILSPNVIRVDSPLTEFTGADTVAHDTFSMEAQEGLRVVELDADDELHITDVFISQEKDSEYALVEDTDSPGKRVVKGRLLEVGSVNLRFDTPYICQLQCNLKYFGHDNGLNVCLIHGHLT